MKRKSIAIVAGGALDAFLLERIREAQYIIGVDRGAYWLITHGVVPDVAIGDFDSVTKKEFSHIKKNVTKIIRELPHPKYVTDLELAIEYAKTLDPKEVGIFGAIGSRFDHTFAGITLLLNLSSYNIYGYIVDNFNKIQIVRRVLKLKPSKVFKYVSLFSLNGKTTVTLTGFRYNVSKRIFLPGSTLGVSNEIAAKQATITIHEGLALVMQSKD